MPIVTLSFIPSLQEIISGIPVTVEITTNMPATIYYTLDGSLPSLLSTVYTGPVELPTDENSVILSAIAYTVDEYGGLVPSAILSNLYSTSQEDLDRTRWIFFEGVVYSHPGGLDIPFYYDETGEVSFEVDIPLEQLNPQLVESHHDRLGNDIPTDNEVDLIDPDETATLIDNDIPAFSTPNGADTYFPTAKYIEIDNRPEAPESIVSIVNGPYMTLRDSRKYWSGIDFRRTGEQNHISGTLAKIHYDRKKGIMVAYYFDHTESRWIKSINNIETPDIKPLQGQLIVTNPLVFKWSNFGRQQAL